MTAAGINTEERKKLIADLWISGFQLCGHPGQNQYARSTQIPVLRLGRFDMRGDVHSHTRSCWRNAGYHMGNALHLHFDLWHADCPKGNRELLGLHSVFLRLLECDLI